MKLKNICIVGGGALGHVIAGWLANKGYEVSVLTRNPKVWSNELLIRCPDREFTAHLFRVTDNPELAVSHADVVLLTVPGFANESELQNIKPYLKEDCFVGGVFCSSGFFFEAIKILPDNIRLWGFQRVPFISRVEKYGHVACILGYKSELNIAVERCPEVEKHEFKDWVEDAFDCMTKLMDNYLEVSITNSNPILHTARLYTMFNNWGDETRSDHNFLFYEEWTMEAAELLLKMDEELFKLLKKLPVTKGYLIPLKDYYESKDALSLKNKLSSISGFKGIASPMIKDDKGWKPDYTNRYFTEDFGYSLKYIWELGKEYHVDMPYIDMVFNWGKNKISKTL